MAIVNTKEGAFRPVLVLTMLWLHYVEDDGYSVFIVASNKALIGISRIRSYNTVSSQTALGSLVVRDNDPGPRLKREFLGVFLLSFYRGILMKHLINV